MNNELKAVIEYMERERGIEREVLIEAVESALESASRKAVSPSHDVRVQIDRRTFDIHALARVRVVEQVRRPGEEVTAREIASQHPTASPGDVLEIEVPHNFGRIAAQTAKQAIMQRIRQAERERVYEEFKDRVGEIVSGGVRRFDRSDVIIEISYGEGLMPARERVPTEEYQVGERLRALILKVENRDHGPAIILSRSHPDFVRRLFELEVSEITDGTVEIKGIAREAGYRTKIAVMSHDEKVDPIGACVGMRGIRVKNIVRELSGEKIDIVRWREEIKAYVTEALAPARLIRVDVDEDDRRIDVLVDNDQLSLAIGKKGQNARLAAKLTQWQIDIHKVEEEQEMVFEGKVAQAVQSLAAIDGIDEDQAQKLVHAGFLTLDGIVAAEPEDLEEIEGFTTEIAQNVLAAAQAALENETTE